MSDQPPINPYAPPRIFEPSELAGEGPLQIGPPYQIYSAFAISVAAFLGSFLAGAVLMCINYVRVQRPRAGYAMLAIGMLVSLGTVVAAFALPEEFPGLLFAVFQTVLAHFMARRFQGEIVERHLAEGGRLASTWWAVGIQGRRTSKCYPERSCENEANCAHRLPPRRNVLQRCFFRFAPVCMTAPASTRTDWPPRAYSAKRENKCAGPASASPSSSALFSLPSA